MGPRQDAGEDVHYDPAALRIDRVLQWGPGKMPGKTRGGGKMGGIGKRASMGPRQDAGEDKSS